ncbi:bifunctional phosphoribosyl-AMP cyclohydrolase/phosphoribosyl-ATP diphosphatase HisIE [Ornithinimicrobium ciconiae]|uniref:Histidine biosynthesis bifunctional protein HisIE n=1 Tax=Ornithinimicrobium ciconiae TaxID=2594265 RepID=A0A516GAZ5_9MICO|nr:bifunctional phosphoribosyl-AMP cyclohydrolase/phosphoribosyl-ATP diphosphatase HisIE [Ornithinimicrobium ciconiae]QDO88668.1 bifunctional phosphoribosyl-AMP cyclohydrolase/phosphoribosyl-ATP diphosphatase HisIE [Ornithinimicrobium ciconiae]
MTDLLQLPDGLDVSDLAFAKQDGLLPVVVQHHGTGQVLMVGYQDAAALTTTLQTGMATFYSRSRDEQWVKGGTSGNYLRVQQVRVDCDRDTVLLQCIPDGPTCHTGAQSCFDPAGQSASGPAVLAPGESDAEAVEPGDGAAPLNRREAVEPEDGAAPLNRPETEVGAFLAELEQVVVTRDRERPEGSYTTSLLEGGVRRVAQKVGEEGVETALAAVAQEDPELIGESADLLYHLLVLLRSRDLGLADVEAELRRRHG